MVWRSVEHTIPRTKPLREMGDPVAAGFVRSELPQEPAFSAYLGGITNNQLDNIQYIVTKAGRPHARYSPQRGRYNFSEKEKELAERVRRECTNGQACAFTLLDQKGEKKEVLTTKYTLGESASFTNKFFLHCFGRQGDWNEGGFASPQAVVERLNQHFKGTDRCLNAMISEIPSETEVRVDKHVRVTTYDRIHYFTIEE